MCPSVPRLCDAQPAVLFAGDVCGRLSGHSLEIGASGLCFGGCSSLPTLPACLGSAAKVSGNLHLSGSATSTDPVTCTQVPRKEVLQILEGTRSRFSRAPEGFCLFSLLSLSFYLPSASPEAPFTTSGDFCQPGSAWDQ